jgi:hypothetical protein
MPWASEPGTTSSPSLIVPSGARPAARRDSGRDSARQRRIDGRRPADLAAEDQRHAADRAVGILAEIGGADVLLVPTA